MSAQDAPPPETPGAARARPEIPDARALSEVAPLGEKGEQVWIEVIRKMDEVYSDLLRYEVELEQKNAALEESQRFILSVLTSMSDILVICGRDGRVESANQAMTRLCGKPDSELRGTAFSRLLADPPSRERAERAMAQGHADAVEECELQFRAADGAAVPVAVSCTPRLSQVGKVVGFVIAGRPVGELRRAYEALRAAHEELKQTQQQLLQSEKMASLGRLVAGVAHELNNPISFVLGNVHTLKRYLARLSQYLDAVHRGAGKPELEALRNDLRIDRLLADLASLVEGTVEGAERTRDIVAGLRRFSAADRGEDKTFNLARAIESSVYWVVKASGSRIRVHTRLPADLPVRGAPGQMQQVLVNLVQNAVDSTEKQAVAELSIEGEIRGDRMHVSFHDNGPGFLAEHLSRVFDPFFTTKPVGKGTGLGLSISYGIVERHGGTLRASNHPDGGAVLELTLPLELRGGSASDIPSPEVKSG
jgi:two-component system sensor histidine kinase HupT/HoxJ